MKATKKKQRTGSRESTVRSVCDEEGGDEDDGSGEHLEGNRTRKQGRVVSPLLSLGEHLVQRHLVTHRESD